MSTQTIDPILTTEDGYYVVGRRFVAAVIVNGDGIIIGAAPILKKFVGQPLSNLNRWSQVLTVSKLTGDRHAFIED